MSFASLQWFSSCCVTGNSILVSLGHSFALKPLPLKIRRLHVIWLCSSRQQIACFKATEWLRLRYRAAPRQQCSVTSFAALLVLSCLHSPGVRCSYCSDCVVTLKHAVLWGRLCCSSDLRNHGRHVGVDLGRKITIRTMITAVGWF
jgi:hypothetical protein